MADTESVKQENGTVAEEETQERTFTQEEVNAIVAKRLSDYNVLKEKAAKLDEIEESNKSELQKATEHAADLQRQLDELHKAAELKTMREKVATELGVPVHLLNGSDEDACRTQAKAILDFAKPSGYPSVRDGGDSQKTSTMTKADIMAIKSDRERLKAIKENIELFS